MISACLTDSLSWFRQTFITACAVLLVAAPADLAGTQAGEKVDFNRDIRRILSGNCFKCHGPDANERKGGKKGQGLRLDTPDGAQADLGGYSAIVPGNPDKSELIRRITTDDADDLMPPPKSGKKLTSQEIALLKKWIAGGAEYDVHWSYVKPRRHSLPKVKNPAWPKNGIDHFILARLEREGLDPSPEADAYALIRRAALDLTGLPPTLDEVDQFVNDHESGAYERLVDRLLAKEAFGEHWARLWLDQARYADSTGYADDPPRTIWAYRDYVIRSLNANKPFDQFTVEQIAVTSFKSRQKSSLSRLRFIGTPD
jgi:mono/diheme cytochrome c family protein